MIRYLGTNDVIENNDTKVQYMITRNEEDKIKGIIMGSNSEPVNLPSGKYTLKSMCVGEYDEINFEDIQKEVTII